MCVDKKHSYDSGLGVYRVGKECINSIGVFYKVWMYGIVDRLLISYFMDVGHDHMIMTVIRMGEVVTDTYKKFK